MSRVPDGEGRLIIEMGMGNSLHRRDFTKAALRAVEDALRHSSLAILNLPGLDRSRIRIRASIGVTEPDEVDVEAVRRVLGGKAEVVVMQGGLEACREDAGDGASEGAGEGAGEGHVIAAAAVEVFLPRQPGWVLAETSR